MRVAVIGLGNWGTSLAAALASVPGIGLQRVHASPRRRPHHADLNADVLWFCVPDRALVETTEWIVANRPNLNGQMAVHSSGALDRSVLAAAERAGARTAAVHPMMSFPTHRVISLAGVPFAVESAEPATHRRLVPLIRKMGGRPFSIQSASKAIYHAGAMFASPLLVAVLDAGVRCMQEAGLSEREAIALLGPMAQATVANVRRQGLARSFSGPIARGDVETMKLHRKVLVRHPLVAQAYDALVQLAAQDLPSSQAVAIRTMRRGASKKQATQRQRKRKGKET